jgi:hypothetical protein
VGRDTGVADDGDDPVVMIRMTARRAWGATRDTVTSSFDSQARVARRIVPARPWVPRGASPERPWRSLVGYRRATAVAPVDPPRTGDVPGTAEVVTQLRAATNAIHDYREYLTEIGHLTSYRAWRQRRAADGGR